MPACKHCGRQGLTWRLSSKKKWRLYNSEGQFHFCPPSRETYMATLKQITENLKRKAELRGEYV